MKIAAIQGMVQFSQPHVIVIGETKNSEPVSSQLSLNEYDLHENPQLSEQRKMGGHCWYPCGLFNVQPLPIPDTLCGRVVVLDLTIPTESNLGFTHRLIGIYAPWDPGGHCDHEYLFWPEITQLCNTAKFSWSLHGDFNATLHASESSSATLAIPPS